MPPPSTVVIRKMALLRTKSRLTIPAPPPSPIPTGSGSRSAANETFKTFLDNSVQLPQLSLPESRFVYAANPAPAVIDFRSLVSPGEGDAAARMLRSVSEYGAFRIVNHGISGEEILSMVDEAKSVLEDCTNGVDGDRSWVEGNRETILQVRRRNDSKTWVNTVVLPETNREISLVCREKMKNIRSKLEGVGEKLSEILWECMGQNDVKKGDTKETIFSIYRYNHPNQLGMQNSNSNNGNKVSKNEKDEREMDDRENDGNVMMSLHIPGEHCQFYVKSHQQTSFCFDAAAGTIVVTIGKQLQEWSLGKLNSARSEMIFVPDLFGSQTSFSIEIKFSHPNILDDNSHSKIISISDQIFIAFLLLSLYLLYTYISSFFKGK